jgi:hypothetical protein
VCLDRSGLVSFETIKASTERAPVTTPEDPPHSPRNPKGEKGEGRGRRKKKKEKKRNTQGEKKKKEGGNAHNQLQYLSPKTRSATG